MTLQLVNAPVERSGEFASAFMYLWLRDDQQLEHPDLQLTNPLQQENVTLAAVSAPGACRSCADGHQKNFGGVGDGVVFRVRHDVPYSS